VRSTPATRVSMLSWAQSCWSGRRAQIWTKRASCCKGECFAVVLVFNAQCELLRSAVSLDPNNCFARMKLAVVHSRSGQLQQVRSINRETVVNLTCNACIRRWLSLSWCDSCSQRAWRLCLPWASCCFAWATPLSRSLGEFPSLPVP
jgi:hypothetical protein